MQDPTVVLLQKNAICDEFIENKVRDHIESTESTESSVKDNTIPNFSEPDTSEGSHEEKFENTNNGINKKLRERKTLAQNTMYSNIYS